MDQNKMNSLLAFVALLLGGYIYYQKKEIKKLSKTIALEKNVNNSYEEFELDKSGDEKSSLDFMQNTVVKDPATNKVANLKEVYLKNIKRFKSEMIAKEKNALDKFARKTGVEIPRVKDFKSSEVKNDIKGVETFKSVHPSGTQVKYIISDIPLENEKAYYQIIRFIPFSYQNLKPIKSHSISNPKLNTIKVYFASSGKDTGIYIVHAKINNTKKEIAIALQDVPKNNSMLERLADQVKKIKIN